MLELQYCDSLQSQSVAFQAILSVIFLFNRTLFPDNLLNLNNIYFLAETGPQFACHSVRLGVRVLIFEAHNRGLYNCRNIMA